MQPAPGADPIPRRKLGREVLDRLLARVRSGEWQPGTELPSERELMAAFGVGRPAIREALQALERMGVIAIAHGARARVQELTPNSILRQVGDAARVVLESSSSTLEHLKQARLMFEVSMVRIAAESATDADVERLRLALETHRAAIRDLPRFLTRDMEFHRTIAEITRNPILVAISQSVFEWLERYHVELVRAHGAEKLTLAEHARIFRAIQARDPEGAARAMTAHLTRANKLYSSLMSAKES
jgi:DNA-binding FadR family transcriptional regulator